MKTVALLGNYLPDRQQSMLRFLGLLSDQWTARGMDVRVLAPSPTLLTGLRCRNGERGLGKWIAYVDKYVLFPSRLRRQTAGLAAAGPAVVHVVDHSNALYIPTKPEVPWIATCHDLLAVRGALGEDTDCPASALGRRLQAAIVRGLSRANAIAADSSSTMADVERLVRPVRPQKRRTILLGLNHPYGRIDAAEAHRRLRSAASVPWGRPFVMHVGSNLARKNKPGIMRVFARIAERWPGNLVFCGAPLTPELQAQAASAGVADRVFAAPSLTNEQLEGAYNLAHALLYPSRCEGFGWPVIEAQACGCPVVCSDRTSLPEVGGDAACVHAIEDESGMAESLWRLLDPAWRSNVVARGFANLSRFAIDRMVDDYRSLYEEVWADFR